MPMVARSIMPAVGGWVLVEGVVMYIRPASISFFTKQRLNSTDREEKLQLNYNRRIFKNILELIKSQSNVF